VVALHTNTGYTMAVNRLPTPKMNTQYLSQHGTTYLLVVVFILVPRISQ